MRNRAAAAAFSQHPVSAAAVGEVIGDVLDRLEPHPDLAVLFVSGEPTRDLAEIVAVVRSLLAPEVLIGSSAPAVFGGTQEIESASGVALFAATGPGVQPIRLTVESDRSIAGLPDHVDPGSVMVCLGESRFPVDRLLDEIDQRSLSVDLVGAGQPIGGRTTETELLLDDRCYPSGAVAVVLPPGVASVCELGVPVWDDTDEVPMIGPAEIWDAAGLVLFADRGVNMIDGPTLDFDLLFERLGGAFAGMVGRSLVHPEPTGRINRSPRSTALVFNAPQVG